ncbi:MAG: hypothetical protein MJZ74_08795 [Muribaculaceae bacterium]|nr:hypothetical protein [Muribaculaceae bacterium]
MLQYLLDTEKWNEFMLHRISNDYISKRERDEIEDFVSNSRYVPVSKSIMDGTYTFSVPKKKQIAKNASGKKRTVYFYTPDEMLVLKFLAFLLYRYDSLFSPNLYSFRRGKGVKRAIINLRGMANIRRMHGIKLDISNYFNSIAPEPLLNMLKDDIDEDLYTLFHNLLTRCEVQEDNQVVHEDTGAMAGIPFAPFLANYYLKDMDEHFWQQPVVYMRYADDILLFANTADELDTHYRHLIDHLHSRGLGINEAKHCYIKPGDDFEFLGFLFGDKVIDVSSHSILKMKARIKRKARALRRWSIKKGLPPHKAVIAMNRRFNAKFYGLDTDEMSWKYWYFPYITTSTSLAIIDSYMQQMQRWMFTGRHSKVNFKACTYDMLKQCGYRPLVHEYYEFREETMKQEKKTTIMQHNNV